MPWGCWLEYKWWPDALGGMESSVLQPRSSLKIGQVLQSIRYKAHESLLARVTIRRTGEPCKNGSLFNSNINRWMDEFIHCSNIIQIHTYMSTSLYLDLRHCCWGRVRRRRMLFGFGEQPIFYAALTWRVLQTKSRVNKYTRRSKILYVCTHFVCIHVGTYIESCPADNPVTDEKLFLFLFSLFVVCSRMLCMV